MKYIILIGLLLTGCTAPALDKEKVGVGVQIDFVAERDGCRIYRFYDGGKLFWYVFCGNGSIAMSN